MYVHINELYTCSLAVYHVCDDGVPEGGVEREVTDKLLKWFAKFWGKERRMDGGR